MTVLVRLFCSACGLSAAVGLDVSHSITILEQEGGRIFGDKVFVCRTCASHTM